MKKTTAIKATLILTCWVASGVCWATGNWGFGCLLSCAAMGLMLAN